MVDVAAYGCWRSPIGTEMVTAAQNRLGQVLADSGIVYVAEGRPSEGGRTTLLRINHDGSVEELTPGPFNLRTRMMEYGGIAYAVLGDWVVAIEDRDQCPYLIRPAGVKLRLTEPQDGKVRYGDMVIDAKRQRVIAVREDHRGEGEPVNDLAAFPLDGSGDVQELVGGHDFFAYPRLSPDGDKLTWVSWDHPNMPWDNTQLWQAPLDLNGRPEEPALVAGQGEESVLQPEWSPSGELFYISDRSNWWNLYRAGVDQPICAKEAEFAAGLFVLGPRWYAILDDRTAIVTYNEKGFWRLGQLDLMNGDFKQIDLPYVDLGSVSFSEGKVALSAAATDRPSEVISLDPATGQCRVLHASGAISIGADFLSRPEAISFPSQGGRTAYAFYYPPTNPDFRAHDDEKPPVIVRSHGGPTGCASPSLRLAYQFWTSRGFAILDVDYCGSTGYGRTYRHALYGDWGIADVDDCIAGAEYLVASGKADPERLLISGGSAGGYTTLCALTYHDTFKAGASSYGIGDLEALARDTHKFESRYLDQLIGPWPEHADLYRARSPIHFTDQLSCPAIFFQGMDDKVVPPNQAEEMVKALDDKGLPVAYISFEGEGHGFRKAETQRRVLLAELAFYCRIFGIEPAETLPQLEIRNLEN